MMVLFELDMKSKLNTTAKYYLMDVFDGKRVSFLDLYPATSWPQEVYDDYYEEFLTI